MAPRVYAMAQKGDLNGEGTLISADVIDLRSNRLTNSGTIAGRKLTLLNTESLFNAGTITGDKVGIKTSNNFDNIGGKVEAERALLVDVGGDLNHESTTMTIKVDLSHFQRSETTLARKALFYVKGEDGQLQLSSNNLNAKGADIINDGNGSTLVQSKNNMNLTALSVGFDEKMGTGNHYRHEKVEQAISSQIKGKGDVTLTAKNLRAEGAQLDSEAKLMAIAENDLVLNGAKESRDFEEFHKTKSGSLARTTKTSLDQQHSVTQVGTQVSGKDVVLSAGHDVKAKGIQVIAEDNLHIQGGHDVDIVADTNHFKNKRVETKKTRGVFTDGGIGFTVGSKSEKHDYETEGWTQSDARSTLGSMNGNIRVSAGNHTNVLGTDMITPRTNQIDIEGAGVKVEAGKDIIERKEGHEYKQSGVTIALSTPVTDMAQAAYNSVNRSQQVTNGKLKALYAVKAAEEATMAAQNVGKVAETLDALRAGNMQNTGTTSSPSVKVSLGYGSQKQTQSSESQSISHQKSTVSTGTFNVKARDEKLSFEGVDANAKLMALSGKKGIEIKGVKDEEHQHTENKSAGGSVGVFVGTNGNSYGVGIEGSVNAAKGKSNSDSERWQNSHLQADKLITNSEAGNLSLDAANLKAKRWEADIQNLTIMSRQDTEKYESKQTGASASGSMAYGSGGGASVSASYNKAKVDYAQVNEQAGIRVGEDGMDAHIHNHTQLNGAIIESDAEASKNRFKTKSLTYTDIENKSEIKTESASMSAGSGGVNPMQALSSALSLLGNTNESARSTTQSAISDNIQIETETPEKLTALSRDTKNANQRVEKQDLQKVQERQEMAKVIGDISNNAISIATYNEREKINKLSLEKFKAEEKYGKASTQAQEIGKQITAIQNDIDGTYGIGSKTGMAIRAVTAALQAAAQNDTAGSLVALASPYLNKTIHEMTAGDTAKDKAANLMAHALLSAVEFQVTGKDPLTGAVAGVTGEVTAQILTQAIYNKTPNQLTANEKENISTLSQLAGGLAAALTAKANGTTAEQGGNFLAATSGAGTAKRAVENNYLWEKEQKEFEKKMLECKSKGEDCTSVVNEYLDKSNKRSRELYERCKDGGVRCAGMEEVIDVSTNIARAKYDTSGRLFLGDALQDDDTIKIVNYVNERDLTFLKDRVSATDRMLYQASDITNWLFLIVGGRNLITNNSKEALLATGVTTGVNAGIQYSLSGDIKTSDLISAGILGKMTAGKNYNTTVNLNTGGAYYFGKVNGEEDPALSALTSRTASIAGYKTGNKVEEKFNLYFNPARDKYRWIDSGYLGISYQHKPSTIPSSLGNIFDSATSEAVGKELNNKENKK
ncbi:hemagglutinin repeat-containing protein [Haemophilus haemolyticus]|uniref:hemagglutinin repeat-containing protein n=1 Tax=Haemophilus haemolyticus TaxID=726 RepID=UPI003D803533